MSTIPNVIGAELDGCTHCRAHCSAELAVEVSRVLKGALGMA